MVGIVFAASCTAGLGKFQAGVEIIRIYGDHTLKDREGLCAFAALVVVAVNPAVFSEGITGESLLFVESGKIVADFNIARIKLLDLLVNGDGFQIIGVVRIILPYCLVFADGLFLAVGPHQEFGKTLPVPDVIRIKGYDLFVILDGTV